jgi:hypothetical protein
METDSTPCEHCAGATSLTTELAPLGSDPGHRVYYCSHCKRYTWTAWWHGTAGAQAQSRPAQQQQQRQQQARSEEEEP